MTNIQINGQRFETATEWAVDEVQIAFSTVDGGPYAWQIVAHDPDGPDAGNTTGGVTIINWTNTLIEMDFDGNTVDPFVARVLIRDASNTETIEFPVTPNQSVLPGIEVTNVSSGVPSTLYLDGNALDTAERWRVVDDFSFDSYYYDSSGPNAGLNPVGSTVTVSPTQVVIEDPALDGITVTYIQTRANGDAVVNEWYGSVPVASATDYPLLEGICSPAPDTIRFEGQRFLTAGLGAVGYVITRLADYSAGPEMSGPAMIYELADGSPDGYGWSLVTHTDTVIEISNPAFSTAEPSGGPGDFEVTGVAFHNVDTLGYYYWEPWGDPSPYSAMVDGAGC